MSIKDKPTLSADITTFSDGSGITAAQFRQYMQDILDSKLLQILDWQTYATSPVTLTEADFDENLIHLSSVTMEIQLPDATASVGGRRYRHISLTSDPLTITLQNPVNSVLGTMTFTEPVEVTVQSQTVGEWIVIANMLTPPISGKNFGASMKVDYTNPDNPLVDARVLISATFNEPGDLTAGEEMRIGNTEGQNNQGWVAPIAGTLITATISRGNTDPADIDIQINGTVQATINSTTNKSVETISVPVAAGDSVMVLGGATTPNPMTQPVVVLILEET